MQSSPVRVEPELPAGVVLDAATMSLVGVPTAAMSPTVMSVFSGGRSADFVLSVESSSVLAAAASAQLSPSDVNSRFVYEPAVVDALVQVHDKAR